MISTDTIRIGVGIVGNAIASGLFLSPLPTFIRIWKKKSVEEFSVIPYVVRLLNCMLWMLYGLPIVHPNNTLVLTINSTGIAIELCYVILYLLFSSGPKRQKALLLFLGDLTIVVVVIMYLAPLSVMKMVIQTKSVEYIPLSLSVVSFFNGLCWTIYALIRFDIYITIPNRIGMFFSITQLVLHLLYYKSTKRQIADRKTRQIADRKTKGEVVMDDSLKL